MNKRLASLDALRGFDMMFIMGVSGLVVAICQLFPNGDGCWLARQMGHGVGLASVSATVRRHRGTLKIDHENGRFTVSILINV